MNDSRLEQCKIEREATKRFREDIPGIVDNLVQSCNTDECFDHVDFEPLPSKERDYRHYSRGEPHSLSGIFYQ